MKHLVFNLFNFIIGLVFLYVSPSTGNPLPTNQTSIEPPQNVAEENTTTIAPVPASSSPTFNSEANHAVAIDRQNSLLQMGQNLSLGITQTMIRPLTLFNNHVSSAASSLPSIMAAQGAAIGSAMAAPVQLGTLAANSVASGVTGTLVSIPISLVSGGTAHLIGAVESGRQLLHAQLVHALEHSQTLLKPIAVVAGTNSVLAGMGLGVASQGVKTFGHGVERLGVTISNAGSSVKNWGSSLIGWVHGRPIFVRPEDETTHQTSNGLDYLQQPVQFVDEVLEIPSDTLVEQSINQTSQSPEQIVEQAEIHSDLPEQKVEQAELPEQMVEQTEIHSDLPEQKVEQAEVSAELPQQVVVEAEVSSELPEKMVEQAEIHSDLPEQKVEQAEVSAELPQQVVVEAEVSSELPEKMVQQSEIHSDLPEQKVEETEVSSNLPEQMVGQAELPQQIVEAEIDSELPEQKVVEEEVSSKLPEQMVEQAEIHSELPEQKIEQAEVNVQLPEEKVDQSVSSQLPTKSSSPNIIDASNPKFVQSQTISETPSPIVLERAKSGE